MSLRKMHSFRMKSDLNNMLCQKNLNKQVKPTIKLKSMLTRQKISESKVFFKVK